MKDENRKLFISYSHADREFAHRLATSIMKLGGRPSLSGHGGIGQDDWLGGLRTKLAESDAVVLVMPSSSARSANSTFFEAGAARALGKEVIIVVPDIDTVDQQNIPYDVASSIVLDASSRPIDTIAMKVMEAA